jgi:hypothetical protein
VGGGTRCTAYDIDRASTAPRRLVGHPGQTSSRAWTRGGVLRSQVSEAIPTRAKSASGALSGLILLLGVGVASGVGGAGLPLPPCSCGRGGRGARDALFGGWSCTPLDRWTARTACRGGRVPLPRWGPAQRVRGSGRGKGEGWARVKTEVHDTRYQSARTRGRATYEPRVGLGWVGLGGRAAGSRWAPACCCSSTPPRSQGRGRRGRRLVRGSRPLVRAARCPLPLFLLVYDNDNPCCRPRRLRG